MSIIFTVFGILSFVMFAYAIYSYSKQVEQLKKVIRAQRMTIESLSTPLPQDAASSRQNLDEVWKDVKKILDHDITQN